MRNWHPARIVTMLKVFFLYALTVAVLTVFFAALGGGWLSIVQNDFRIIIAFLFLALGIVGLFRGIRLLRVIVNAGRFEVLIAACFGIIFSLSVFKIFHASQLKLAYSYLNTIQKFFAINAAHGDWTAISFIIQCFAIVASAIILSQLFRRFRPSKEETGFISDNALDGDGVDILGYSELAFRFAEQIIKQPISESIVFGIDAPWGSGKSSLLNLTRKKLAEHTGTMVIVVNFEPLTFENEADLLEKFVSNFTNTLRENYYIPELENELEKYSKLLHATGFKIGNVEFGVPLHERTSLEESLKRLKDHIGAFVGDKRKILVVIDDLDRLAMEKIKLMANIVKKSFVLPGVSYVLCYDTSNFNAFEADLRKTETLYTSENEIRSQFANPSLPKLLSSRTFEELDNRKVVEYFEKVVNVKIGLYFDMRKLGEYVEKVINQVVSVDELRGSNLLAVVTLFKQLFEGGNAGKYAPYIGDLRKVKKILNAIIMLKAFNFKFSEYDYDAHDLVHLILIYINYPTIFRKIIHEESMPGKYFFAANYEHSRGRSGVVVNSKLYEEYVHALSEQEAFLVNAVFNVNERFKNPAYESLTDLERVSCAVFNGDGITNSNLEAYIQLITQNRVGNRAEQYRFHLSRVREYLDTGKVNHEVYDKKHGEEPRRIFVETLVKNLDLISHDMALRIIDELIEDLPKYSSVELKSNFLNLRHRTVFRILNLLNQRGWIDANGRQYENDIPENLIPIARKIFGQDGEAGILATLSLRERGLLGIHDMLIFRSGCCLIGEGSLRHICAALEAYESSMISKGGNVRELAIEQMRRISQVCFSIFCDNYIQSNVNLFDRAADLTSEELLGICITSETQINKDRRYFEGLRLCSFIIRELGNDAVNGDIGCGYYNLSDSDDAGQIRVAMDSYLRECCFNPTINPRNAEYFIDYLLIHYAYTIKDFIPSINGFTEIISRANLAQFWREHSPMIKSSLRGKEKKIVTSNYEVTYQNELPRLYELLDRELLSEKGGL